MPLFPCFLADLKLSVLLPCADVMYITEAVSDLVSSLRALCCSTSTELQSSDQTTECPSQGAAAAVQGKAGCANVQESQCNKNGNAGLREEGGSSKGAGGGGVNAAGEEGSRQKRGRGKKRRAAAADLSEKEESTAGSSTGQVDVQREEGRLGSSRPNSLWMPTEILLAHGRNRTAEPAFMELVRKPDQFNMPS